MDIKTLIVVLCLCLFTVSSWATELVNDDFDSYADIDAVDAVWGAVGSSVSLVDIGGGNKVIQWVYNGPGTPPYEFDRSISNTSNELYVKVKMRLTGSPAGGAACKGVKLFGEVTAGPSYSNITFNHDVAARVPVVSHGSGSGLVNDTQYSYTTDEKWSEVGSAGYTWVVWDVYPHTPASITTWVTYKFYMKYNTDGNYDGVVKFWKDGALQLHVEDIKLRNNSNVPNVKRVAFGDYGNESAYFTMQMDDIIISTTDPDGATTGPLSQSMQGAYSIR